MLSLGFRVPGSAKRVFIISGFKRSMFEPVWKCYSLRVEPDSIITTGFLEVNLQILECIGQLHEDFYLQSKDDR